MANAEITLFGADELSNGQMKRVDVDGHELLVARVQDAYYVVDNRCPHLGGRLSKGKLEGTVVECHLHHSKFDLATGDVVQWTSFSGAALAVAEAVRHPRPLKTYPTRIEDGMVVVGYVSTKD